VYVDSVEQEVKQETSNLNVIVDQSVFTKLLLREKIFETSQVAMNTELPSSSATIPQYLNSNQYSQTVPCMPLDLSMTGPHGRTKQPIQYSTKNELRTFVKTEVGDIDESSFHEKCPNCDVCQRLKIPCSCSLIQLNGPISPQQQNINQELNLLPIQNIPFFGLQLKRNVQQPLPPIYYPYPLGLQLPGDTSQVEDVLKDHCYLNKHQMQRLSPKQSRNESHESEQNVASCSLVKRCISYTEGISNTEDEESPSSSIQPECLKSNTDVKDEEESSQGETTVKKPKLCHSVSVPGWFGKGLNMKKKKRF